MSPPSEALVEVQVCKALLDDRLGTPVEVAGPRRCFLLDPVILEDLAGQGKLGAREGTWCCLFGSSRENPGYLNQEICNGENYDVG